MFQCFGASKGIAIGFLLGVLTTNLIGLPFQHSNFDIVNHQERVLGQQTVRESPSTSVLKTNVPAILQKRDRILCWVITSPKTHSRARLVNETWGRRCDKLLFISSVQGKNCDSVEENVTLHFNFSGKMKLYRKRSLYRCRMIPTPICGAKLRKLLNIFTFTIWTMLIGFIRRMMIRKQF